MKLSDAIRLGAMMRPHQAFWVLFEPDTQGSCALGAAAEAIGILDTTQRNRYLPDKRVPNAWRWVLRQIDACPACGMGGRDGQDMITHLNNVHYWTREAIADWVESIEPRDESAAAAAVDRHVADPGTPTPRAASLSSSSSVSLSECGGTVSQ